MPLFHSHDLHFAYPALSAADESPDRRRPGVFVMPPILSRPGSRRPSRSDHLLRVGEVALRFGAEACVQWWTIASRSWGYEVDRLVRGAMASVPPEVLLRRMASGYMNCLGEFAAIAPSVADKAAMELTRRSDAGLEPYIGDEHAGPEPDGEIFEVEGK